MNDVVHTILDDPFTNAAIVGREKGVHRDTIRKVWNDVGLHHHIAARKPYMTQAHRDERLGYALQNLSRDWSNVIFSDEKTFQTDNHQRAHLYRPANCRFEDRYIQPTRRSGRISGGVWGWISQAGPGEMSMITGRLDSIEYVSILEENLVPTVQLLYGDLRNVVFMQVNSLNFILNIYSVNTLINSCINFTFRTIIPCTLLGIRVTGSPRIRNLNC